MSTENKATATGKTFFHIEDNGEKILVKVEGKAGDLINLFANVFNNNEDMRKVVELALMSIDMKNGKEVDPMKALMMMMSGMGSNDDEE